MLLKIFLAVCLFLASAECTAKHTTQSDIPYKTYANFPMAKIGVLTKTDGYVPKGSIVAIMAEGECWSFKGPMKRSLDPTACVRFKIGERGLVRELFRFYDSQHVTVIKSPGEGYLHYIIGGLLKEKRNWKAKMSATVLVWEKARSGRVESDIEDLISAHPDQKAYQALLFSLATCFIQSGEYMRAEMILKNLRETADKWTREAIVALNQSGENEKWLRRYDRVAAYAQESLGLCRREGYKRFQGGALLSLSEAKWNLGQREESCIWPRKG